MTKHFKSTSPWIAPLLLGGALLLPALAGAEDGAADKDALRAELEQARTELADAARKLAQIQRQLIDEGEIEGRWQMRGLGGERDVQIILNEGSEFEFVGTRPRLGILVGGEAGSNEVLGLTPGGGAEAAGLQRGDRVVEVNGVTIDTDTAIGDALEGIEAGDAVAVVVDRDGERLSFEVTTSAPERDIRMFTQRLAPGTGLDIDLESLAGLPGAMEREIIVMHGAGPDAPVPPMPPEAPRLPGLFVLGGDSDLVSNHEGLAPYFGTGEGVVVLRIAADNALNLADGDVVLRIDGEPVQRPVDLGRAMLGREPGETVLLEVMRQGTLQQVEGTVPESPLTRLGRGRGLGMLGANTAPRAEGMRFGLHRAPHAPEAPKAPRPPRPAAELGLF